MTPNIFFEKYTTIQKPESIRHIMADVAEVKSCCDVEDVEVVPIDFTWTDGSVWSKSAYNTMWCLIGCSIGDLGTIAAFQFIFTDSGWSTMSIMTVSYTHLTLPTIYSV